MNLKFKYLLICLSLAICAACGGDDNKSYTWPEEPSTPTTPDPVETPAKGCYIWIDAAGNFEQFANSVDNIQADLKKIKDCGFTDIIVDVRPTTGDVLFRCSVADQVTKMDVWTQSGYAWVERTADFDYLQAFIDAGHELGLRVNASINTFVGGYLCPYNLGQEGPIFRDSTKKSWGTVVNTEAGLQNTMNLLDSSTDWGAKFLNPALPEVQDYILDILRDLAKYDLDGIMLDRCRFSDDGLQADFSDASRRQFETYIGASVSNFPAEIFAAGGKDLGDGGPLMRQWLAFRAKVIHDFVVKARDAVKSVNRNIKFAAYVGAWYSTYYTSGVNWASPDYNPATDYPSWATADYRNYGYADHLDLLLVGAYASTSNINGTSEWTIEGFCRKAGDKIKNATAYAGGPDLGNPPGWTQGGCAAIVPNAISVCYDNSTGGMFVFDLCHVRMHDYWAAVKRGISNCK